jgi:hypothetical protein
MTSGFGFEDAFLWFTLPLLIAAIITIYRIVHEVLPH